MVMMRSNTSPVLAMPTPLSTDPALFEREIESPEGSIVRLPKQHFSSRSHSVRTTSPRPPVSNQSDRLFPQFHADRDNDVAPFRESDARCSVHSSGSAGD